MPDYYDTDVLSVFLQIVLIDLVLAGDNAIVIGLASAGLPEAQRGKAILIGIVESDGLQFYSKSPAVPRSVAGGAHGVLRNRRLHHAQPN